MKIIIKSYPPSSYWMTVGQLAHSEQLYLFIQEELKFEFIGNVTIEKSRNRCSFFLQAFTEIRDVLLCDLGNHFKGGRHFLVAGKSGSW